MPKSSDCTFLEFVENSLIPDLQKMINNDLQYYAFPIICQAIEVMGGFYDSEDMDARKSEERFKRGLKKLFDRKYANHQSDYYSYLRCSLIHQLRPGKEFLLCSSTHDRMPKEGHLKDQDGVTIIVIEEFFADFEKAFTKLKNEASKGGMGVIQSKVESVFLSVSEVSSFDGLDFGSTTSPCVSGQLSQDMNLS